MYTLVTGGAGYIGSHFCDLFAANHDNILIVDNLHHGFRDAVKALKKHHSGKSISFIKADLKDKEKINKIFDKYSIESVFHFAALCQVSESIESPDKFFENNVGGTINLLNAMALHGTRRLVFSSTCAVYGEAQFLPVDESHPTNPTNPYGLSKLLVENMLPWYENRYDIKHIVLRYFNVCGASPNGKLGYSNRRKQNLLVQDAVKAALNIYPLHLTYSDVPTFDNSPIRDYVDVNDIADAHIKALVYLETKNESNTINLGTSKGYSVKQIISKVEETLKVKISPTMGEKRKGEYAQIFASNQKAKNLIGWQPSTSLEDSIRNLANWYRNYPNGYKK